MIIQQFMAGFALLGFATLSNGADSSSLAVQAQYQEQNIQASTDTLIFTGRYVLPYGLSTGSFLLSTRSSAKTLKVRLGAEPSCSRAPFVNVSLRSTGDQTWHLTNFNGDILTHNLSSFDAVKFDINQPWFSSQTCQFFVYAANSGSQTGAWGEGEMVGAFNYNGGFARNLDLEIDPSVKIRGFRLAVPSFCHDVEAMEVGTVSEGFFDRAKLIDAKRKVYEVAGGSVRASKIRISLNGPLAAGCDIPVFTYEV